MFKRFLVGGSMSAVLLAGTLIAHAEPPQPQPQLSSKSNPLPPYAQNNLLSKYAATDTVPVLKLGDRGEAVADVQQYLKQAGLYTGTVDGVYGEQSQAAVTQFQELAKLPTDGVVGFETWKALLSSAS